MTHLPELLFIQKIRYYCDESGNVGKEKASIALSRELNVLGVRYILRFVTLHRGSGAEEGHYYCHILDPHSAEDAIWHKLNDSSSVKKDLPKSSLAASFFVYERHGVTTNYMLQQLESLRQVVLRRELTKPEQLSHSNTAVLGEDDNKDDNEDDNEDYNIVRKFLDFVVPPTSSTSH